MPLALTGKQKAAMLLMSLDVATASDLLKGVDTKVVRELAVELSYLEASGYKNTKESTEIVQQLFSSLKKQSQFQLKGFLGEMLRNVVGDEKAKQIYTEIQGLLQKRDPFLAIRSADSRTLASVLESEHPQAAAVVLTELPPKRSSEILSLLGEGVRLSAISRMTVIETVTPEAKTRIAEMVQKRLEATTSSAKEPGAVGASAQQAAPEQSLRRVAVILRNLERELRDGVIETIRQKNAEVGQNITNLMVVWQDIPQIADRSLQQALRGMNEKQLALALFQADGQITRKIKSNISERAGSIIDEEASLMSAPKKEEILEAREKIVNVLREINKKGELMFVE
jgi:flagellar motor switch protein FliG